MILRLQMAQMAWHLEKLQGMETTAELHCVSHVVPKSDSVNSSACKHSVDMRDTQLIGIWAS